MDTMKDFEVRHLERASECLPVSVRQMGHRRSNSQNSSFNVQKAGMCTSDGVECLSELLY